MSFALRIWRLALAINIEGEFKVIPRKRGKHAPGTPKEPPAPRSKFPTGFQPNPQLNRRGSNQKAPSSTPSTPTK